MKLKMNKPKSAYIKKEAKLEKSKDEQRNNIKGNFKFFIRSRPLINSIVNIESKLL